VSKLFGRRPKNLDASGAAIKTNRHLSRFNDDWNLASTFGVLQHPVELVGIGYDVEIFNLLVFFGISFTSCPRVGSGVFAENQYFLRHDLILPGIKLSFHLFYFNFK
jgi:hypothetical protein